MNTSRGKTDKKRVLVVTTDGSTHFFYALIVQSADNSFYINRDEKIGRDQWHESYHTTGKINFHMGGKGGRFHEAQGESIASLSEIFYFPVSPTHPKIQSGKTPLQDFSAYAPTHVVYLDFSDSKGEAVSTNVHFLLIPPGKIDYLKAVFLTDRGIPEISLKQLHIITDSEPWVCTIVTEISGASSHGLPFPMADREMLEHINKMFLDAFYPVPTDTIVNTSREEQ